MHTSYVDPLLDRAHTYERKIVGTAHSLGTPLLDRAVFNFSDETNPQTLSLRERNLP